MYLEAVQIQIETKLFSKEMFGSKLFIEKPPGGREEEVQFSDVETI